MNKFLLRFMKVLCVLILVFVASVASRILAHGDSIPGFWTLSSSKAPVAVPSTAVPVDLVGCNGRVYVTLPSGMYSANDVSSRLLRAQHLNVIKANSERQTQYSELFKANWQEPSAAQIIFGALGTMAAVQGSFSEKEWLKLSSSSINAAGDTASISSLMDTETKRLGSGAVAGEVRSKRDGAPIIYRHGTTDVVIASKIIAKYTRGNESRLNVAKMSFSNGCVSYAVFSILENEIGAERKAEEFIREFKLYVSDA